MLFSGEEGGGPSGGGANGSESGKGGRESGGGGNSGREGEGSRESKVESGGGLDSGGEKGEGRSDGDSWENETKKPKNARGTTTETPMDKRFPKIRQYVKPLSSGKTDWETALSEFKTAIGRDTEVRDGKTTGNDFICLCF